MRDARVVVREVQLPRIALTVGLCSLTSTELRALAPGCRARARGGLGNMFMKNNVPGSTVLGTALPVRAGYQFPRTIGPRERMLGFDNPSRKL